MKLFCDLFDQLYEVQVCSESSAVKFHEVGMRDSLRLFYVLGYIFQSDRCLIFRILNYRCSLFMLSIVKIFFIFGILIYSRRINMYAAHRQFFYRLFVKYSFMPLRLIN